MNKKIVFNFMYQAGYQMTLILLPIITVPIVSRALGAQGLGTWNFIYSIVSYFMLVGGLGLANYGVREIAVVKHDKQALSKKFWELELFNAFFSLGVLVIYLVLCFFLPNRELYLILSISVFSVFLDISWFFAGIEDFKRITLANIIIRLLSFVFIIVFIREKTDLTTYFLIQAGTTFLSQALFWFFLKGKIIFIRVSMKAIWSHFIPSLNFFIAKLSSTIFSNLNKTILGLMTSMQVVGIYSNSLTLVFMASSLMNALNIVMIPHMSTLNSKKKESELIKTLQKSIHIQFYFTIAILFGIIATNQHLIGWFFGTGFAEMKRIVPLLAVTVVLQSFYGAVSSQYLIPKGEMKSYNMSIFIGALVSLLLDVLLIPIIGIYGAVIGNLCGQLVVCLIRGRILVRDTAFTFQKKQLTTFLLAGVLMAVIVMVITSHFPSTPLTTLFQLILGSVIYLGITIKTSPLKGFLKKKDVQR
ncbi:polysaccharide biosynthesis C-terminal domain-containing protein [Carnobacterium maltaromaticum]|uniref:Polysaccharide biosynthesis C-terminal domain-containing protein n=1 Tax=Carnobacterium maltaromaticum TaxID=2751 RepID=A0AAW9JYN0_CARML|nr:polysaccharide biosynthesis C-terminal domain-containing protein [Carnobacterium maltaromaticum]MDZ5757435.1 polysaccharide biosynthesis C-terminal domain-containing protein [Carnobacterium maltaromaticum]